MSTKQVSVRLSATGGRQVRAELEGVGEAGARGFGRLSREMTEANTRMAAFARKAKIAATAAAMALAGSVLAMTRSTAAAANEISQLSQVANATPEVFQRWSAASSTVGIEQEKLADILKDVNDRVGDFLQTGGGPMKDFFENIAPKVGVTAKEFARLSGPEALQLYVSSLEQAGANQQEMTFYLEALASDATKLVPLLQNGGAEMSRLGAQAQDLGAVLDSKAIAALKRSELAMLSIGQVFTGVRNRIAVAFAPTLEAVANAFVALASSTSPLSRAFEAVLANLDHLAIYAGTFATFLAGRWVAAMAVAALSVRSLALTLVALKGALIRTGIGALIVGAGELVYWFTRLSAHVGGFGAALALLRDAAAEIWSRIAMSARASWASIEAGWATMQAGIYDALQGASDAVMGWVNHTISAFQGSVDAIAVIWGKLPAVLGDLMIQSANSVIGGVESLLNGVIERINRFIGTVNGVLAKLPDWAQGDWSKIDPVGKITLPDLTNPLAGAASDAGSAAAEAFQKAFARTTIENPELFAGMSEDARARAAAYAEAVGMLSEAAAQPLTAWEALKAAVMGTGDQGAAALDDASGAADRLREALGGAGNAGKGAKDKILTGFAAVTKSLSDYAKDALNWGKGLGETLTGAFQGAESAFRSFVETGKLDFKGLVRSILADLAVLAFKRAVLGPLASALSGIFGGGSVTAAVAHTGAIIGLSGQSRAVPAGAFATAPKMHAGGWAGLRPDEVPAILQRGERVLNRREAAGYGAGRSAGSSVTVSIDARGAQMGVAEQIDAKLRAAIPEIARIAKQSVADGRRRGQVI